METAVRDSAPLSFGNLTRRAWEAHTPRGSSTEEQRSQPAFGAKTLRAAGILALAKAAGMRLPRRLGQSQNPSPQHPLAIFRQALKQHLSYPWCQDARMKLNRLAWLTRDEGELIAMFGDARLVRKLDGKIELIGGTLDDRRAAWEWCSMFLHEAVAAPPPRRIPPLREGNVSVSAFESDRPLNSGVERPSTST